MAKRTFMIKDSLLDPYERKILNKRTDESYVGGVQAAENHSSH